jgi:hypothetical protein
MSIHVHQHYPRQWALSSLSWCRHMARTENLLVMVKRSTISREGKTMLIDLLVLCDSALQYLQQMIVAISSSDLFFL